MFLLPVSFDKRKEQICENEVSRIKECHMDTKHWSWLNKEKQLTKYIVGHCDKEFPGQDVPRKDVQNHQEPWFL